MLSTPRPASLRAVPGSAGAVGRARLILAVGLLTALAALAFPFAPVRQPDVSYAWTPADGPAVALPLMPYQPVGLTATLGCAAARTGGPVLSTVPPRPDPTALPLDGLRLVGTPTGVRITSAGLDLGTVPLPPGDCTLVLGSDATATVVALDGRPVLRHEGDVRPDVAGIFTELPGTSTAGMALSVTADTRFATTPSPWKIALAVVCLAGLTALYVLLAAADRALARVRLLPRGWWRPRPVDAAVTALLTAWWVIGSGTVDDGYIAGIVRSRRDNGFVGNVYRWLNAPEAPFSWFYEPYSWWSAISTSTPWMRLPSTLLGLLCWFLVSRLLIPRLGRAGRLRGASWVAALAFATWWVPLDLGLRPEPWVAVGTVLTFLAVERAVATRRVLPLAAALSVAGVTAAVTPGGLMAVAPLLAAAVPLLRGLRARTDLALPGALHAAPVVAALVAAGSAALLLMAADQGAAALAEAVRVRGRIGGGLPWYEEFERYALLLTPDDVQGTVGRRAAVLTTVLAVAGLAWVLGRGERSGIAAGPVRRLLVTVGLSAVAMMVSPTKWTQHFGALTGLGTAVLTLGLVVFGRRVLTALRDAATARRRQVGGLAGATVVCGLVLAGQNMWPFVSGWYTPTFSTVPPQFRTVPVATMVLTIGGVVVAVLLVRSVWRRSAEPPGAYRNAEIRYPNAEVTYQNGTRVGRSGALGVPAPATPVAIVLVAVLALQVGSLARVAAVHRDGYTPASDVLATLRGDPCGLQSALQVETDPTAGLLPAAAPPARLPGVVPVPAVAPATPVDVDAGGTTLPGIAVAGTGATPWYALDPRQRSGALPVVVTVTGTLRPGDVLDAEFARAGAVVASVPLTGPGLAADGGPTDRRLPAPPEADAVRLSVAAAAGGSLDSTAAATLPRAPVLTPMTEVLPRGTRAILDWPVALVFPCLHPEPLPPGTAALARWRVSPPADDPSALITYTPGLGGPFAGPRLLVTQRRMPTYLRGDPTRDPVTLYRWEPVTPLRTLTPTVRNGTERSGDGHLRVSLPTEPR